MEIRAQEMPWVAEQALELGQAREPAQVPVEVLEQEQAREPARERVAAGAKALALVAALAKARVVVRSGVAEAALRVNLVLNWTRRLRNPVSR